MCPYTIFDNYRKIIPDLTAFNFYRVLFVKFFCTRSICILSDDLVLCLHKSLFRLNKLLNVTESMLLKYQNINTDVFSFYNSHLKEEFFI